mmetsp:Transcript_15754/g.37254  ORF Transcript_15754/g.37254 Transcript_15754/m.37254 type:complete len:94 (-) Transcript_15754:1023-1304(-)
MTPAWVLGQISGQNLAKCGQIFYHVLVPQQVLTNGNDLWHLQGQESDLLPAETNRVPQDAHFQVLQSRKRITQEMQCTLSICFMDVGVFLEEN